MDSCTMLAKSVDCDCDELTIQKFIFGLSHKKSFFFFSSVADELRIPLLLRERN